MEHDYIEMRNSNVSGTNVLIQRFKNSKVMIFIFMLSHGQSQVEDGFNINDEFLVENLKAESICAQHIFYDHIKTSQKDIYELTFDNAFSS